jgi:hypothetical protein
MTQSNSSYAQEFIAPLLALLAEHPQFITVTIMDGIVEELVRHQRNGGGDHALASPPGSAPPQGGSPEDAPRGQK